MPKIEKNKKYPSFTLLEMLVVMIVLIILTALTFSSFSGLRDTISLNEDILNLEQDLRYAQRSAMFLDRDVDERWIYGIGIDFSKMNSDKEYNFFKWCSPYEEYGNVRTTSPIPDYDPSQPWGMTNAHMPVASKYATSECDYYSVSSNLIEMLGDGGGHITKNMDIDTGVLIDTVVSVNPEYILFEAVSGRTFLYDGNGNVLNYSDGDLVSNPTDFVIDISSPNTKVTKRVAIGNISGKLTVESIDYEE